MLSTQKSSLKLLLMVTAGFRRAASPCWLRKSQWKQSRCRLENHHRNIFQRWRVDLEALTVLVDSEKGNEMGVGVDWKSSPKNIPKMTRLFVSACSPCWVRKNQREWSTWRMGNHHRKTFQRWRVDLEALAASIELENVNKNGVSADWKSSQKKLRKVTHGFVSAPSRCWLRNSQRKLRRCRLWNHDRNIFQRWRVDSE